MIKNLILIVVSLSALCAEAITSQNQNTSSLTQRVTPLPVEIEVPETDGFFKLVPGTSLIINAPVNDEQRLRRYVVENLPDVFSQEEPPEHQKTITLNLVENIDGVESPEGYRLVVTPDDVVINATEGAGLFYGLQTLIQLLDGSHSIPMLTITDYPRLEHRGMMLDISRHFRDKEFIKKQIDAIAKLKMNKLHLHLTDAAGWRIEIKKYPRLTDYAAWRPQLTWKEWNNGGNVYTDVTDPLAHGGFLTQDDAREIVSYAADRYITVIPEIEMPSHSEEVTATFPHLSCTDSTSPDVCVGNEQTFEFFENVLDEIMDIFPSEYIHIGGDEASKQAWKNCPDCKELMAREGLRNVDELQSYMIERIEKYLNSKGRNIIGWDEIMEGGLAPNATVMSWRGTEGGMRAAQGGHKVIMSPGGYCYLDSYQDAPTTQPEASGGYNPLSHVYSYNPAPDSLNADVKKLITGIQGNLWCEYVPTAQHAEYMLYPRMVAIAEIGWTPQNLRDWNSFYPRALKVNDRMQREGYHVFDLKGEEGNRREATIDIEHLGKGKKVTYNFPWWNRYNANGEYTLTDGKRGGWGYADGRWQGFMSDSEQRLDVTIDLEKQEDITYIGAQFMQIIGPQVWFPTNVTISVSDDGVNFKQLAAIENVPEPTTGLSFKTYAWEGAEKARFVRYVATTTVGCQFTDEIIIR